jgi:hypothetical protein
MHLTKQARLFCLAAIVSLVVPASSFAQTLEGRIEESGVQPVSGAEAVKKTIEPLPVPVVPPRKPKPLQGQAANSDAAKLHGNVDQDGLTGFAEDDDDRAMLPGKATLDKGGMLKGGAQKEGMNGFQSMDPDQDDSELQVEWDRWRNRLLSAIQTGMQEIIHDPEHNNMRFDERRQTWTTKFPLGTMAWFYMQVTPDRRIVKAKITEPSKYPDYDSALLEAIHNLEGSTILRYPRGSKRTIVSQNGGIKTAESSERTYFKFGDVERQRSSGR